MPTSQECIQKISEKFHPELEISLYLSNFSNEVSQIKDLTDKQENQKYLELEYQSPKNLSKKFQKDIQNWSHPCICIISVGK